MLMAEKWLDARRIALQRCEPNRLLIRLTVEGDRSWSSVAIRRSFPLSDPHNYLSFHDANGVLIGILSDTEGMDGKSLAILNDELARRYCTPIVERVLELREMRNLLIFSVETELGQRTFTITDLQSNALQIGNGVIVRDFVGNRYRFLDIARYDARVQELLGTVM
jgi:hypothetical protein